MNKNIINLSLLLLSSSFVSDLYANESSSFVDGSLLKSSDFFKDSHLNFSTVNKFQYLNSNDYPSTNTLVQTAWAQGVKADFQSGYIADHIGLDASFVGVVKLAASDYFFTRQYLYADYNDRTSSGLPKAKNFSKFNQIYLKQKFGDDEYGVKFFEGQRQLNNFGAVDALMKVTNTSYYGISDEINLKDFTIRTAYLTKYMNADSPDEADFQTQDSRKIDYKLTGDISYKDDQGSYLYFLGYSKNYLLQHGIEINKNNLPYMYGLKLYMNQGLSDWTSMSSSNKFFDKNAYHFEFDMTYVNGPWFTKAGYAYTIANRSTSLGRFLENADNINFNSLAYGISEQFINNHENLLAIQNMYQFTPDFASGYIVRAGYGHRYQGNNLQDLEIAFINKWTPTQVQGLTAFFGLGPNWTFKRSTDNTPVLDSDGHWIRGRGFCIASSIDYKF